MLKLTFFIAGLLMVFHLFCQDVIFMANGTEINARIQEVSPVAISYKRIDNLNGPNYTVVKDSVLMIKYENGTKDIFLDKDRVNPTKTGVNYFIKGQKDADRFYTDYKTASTSTLIVSLLSPLVGLIPAIATSATKPKQPNLGYPDSRLFQIKDYERGYRSRSKKIKSRKVWTNWGVGLGVNVVLAILLAAQQ